MNGKRARKIRQFIGVDKKEQPVYKAEVPVAWGPLPINKETKQVDRKSLRKLISKSGNPKFKTFTGRNIFGNLKAEKLFRYIIGEPRVILFSSQRKQYQLFKRNHVEVAQG